MHGSVFLYCYTFTNFQKHAVKHVLKTSIMSKTFPAYADYQMFPELNFEVWY
jgi:hypothetical protein